MIDRPLRCPDCRIDTSIGDYYMVHEEVWQRACRATRGRKPRYLCLDCLEGRLGTWLREADFVLTPPELAERLARGEQTVKPPDERQADLASWRRWIKGREDA